MGLSKVETFDRCPWGGILDGGRTHAWLNAYWLARDIPGAMPDFVKKDPQFLAAASVIASEHARIDREEIPRPGR